MIHTLNHEHPESIYYLIPAILVVDFVSYIPLHKLSYMSLRAKRNNLIFPLKEIEIAS